MRKYNTIFLDRDGTLNPDPGYISSLDQFEFYDFTIPALQRLAHSGNRFCIVTNQSGVSRGLIDQDDLNKIHYNAYDFYNLSTKEIGYMEELTNKSKVEDLTIKLAMCMAATDGHLDQKELNVIKNWAKSLTLELDEDKAEEKKKHFSTFIKETYKEAKSKKISISKLVSEFNDKASKGQKYLAIELMLDVASSDDRLAAEEEKFINKIAKTTGIDLKTFKDMKNKIVAKVGKLDLSEKPSEETFGITIDMDDKEKCKILRKEYTKWNSQTTQRDLKRKKRAKEMVKIIADLRKQYNC